MPFTWTQWNTEDTMDFNSIYGQKTAVKLCVNDVDARVVVFHQLLRSLMFKDFSAAHI